MCKASAMARGPENLLGEWVVGCWEKGSDMVVQSWEWRRVKVPANDRMMGRQR